MKNNIYTVLLIGTLTGCANMEPAEPLPARPILSCEECAGLTYYGPQQKPAPDPRVQMADIIVGGVTKVMGVAGGVYAATEIASTISGAGKYVVGPTSTERVIETSDMNESVHVTNTTDTSSVINETTKSTEIGL